MFDQVYGAGYAWTYDPYINGYDDQIFKVHSGYAGLNGSVVRIIKDTTNAAVNITTLQSGGKTLFRLSIPVAPTAGHERYWGFYSLPKGNYSAAYFMVSGTNFYARTYNPAGTVEQTSITWNSAWTATNVDYQIHWEAGLVRFIINNVVVAQHGTYVPDMRLLPPYLFNNQTDAMNLALFEVVGAQRLFFNEPAFTRGDSTTTTSTSTTTTTTTTTTTSTSSTTTTSTSSSTSTTTTSTSTTTTTSTSSSTTTTVT